MSLFKEPFGSQTACSATSRDRTNRSLPVFSADFQADFQGDLEDFADLETELRHFIARSRADLPTGDYEVVTQTLTTVRSHRERVQRFVTLGVLYAIIEDDELKRRCFSLRDDLIDLAGEWKEEQKRHFEIAREARMERETVCQELRKDIVEIRNRSHREISQMHLDLLKSQNASFQRQQEKLRRTASDPYYSYEPSF